MVTVVKHSVLATAGGLQSHVHGNGGFMCFSLLRLQIYLLLYLKCKITDIMNN